MFARSGGRGVFVLNFTRIPGECERRKRGKCRQSKHRETYGEAAQWAGRTGARPKHCAED